MAQMKIKAPMQRFKRPLVDYKGYKLCDPCWNGHHFHKQTMPNDKKGKPTGPRVSDCLGPPCECECKPLLAEKRPRIRPDNSLQEPMFGDLTPFEVHRDE